MASVCTLDFVPKGMRNVLEELLEGNLSAHVPLGLYWECELVTSGVAGSGVIQVRIRIMKELRCRQNITAKLLRL